MESSDLKGYLAKAIEKKTGHKVSKEHAWDITEAIFSTLIAATAKDGKVRLPGGHGTIEIREVKATKRQLFGKEVSIPAQKKIRYKEGKSTKEIIDKMASKKMDLDAPKKAEAKDAASV